MKTNPDDLIKPVSVEYQDDQHGMGTIIHGGLTKREYFAGLAMQGLLAAVYSDEKVLRDFCKIDKIPRPQGIGESDYINGREAVSANAISYADALIEELNRDED